ncbi:hypothetical protein ACP70R_032013 [Stipagrostis hirtigluma subsp. patula]
MEASVKSRFIPKASRVRARYGRRSGDGGNRQLPLGVVEDYAENLRGLWPQDCILVDLFMQVTSNFGYVGFRWRGVDDFS